MHGYTILNGGDLDENGNYKDGIFLKEMRAPRDGGTPRWVGAPRCALQEGRLFEN